MKSAPWLHAVTTSVGVKAPGMTATLHLAANSITSGFMDGAVTKPTPASTHKRVVLVSSTVPAPTMSFGSERIRWAINSTAPGTVMVISTIGMPPSVTASAAKCASSPEETRIAGMMAISRILEQTSFFVIGQHPSCILKPSETTQRNYLQGLVRIGYRQPIVTAREPGIQGRQQNDTDDQVRHETAYDDDGEGTLRIRANAMGERRR